MRSSLRLFAPVLRNTAVNSRASSSRTKLFVSAVVGGTLAYALVPHKQTLLLESGGSGRRVRSAWEDPPPKPAEIPKPPEEQDQPPAPPDGPDEASQAAFDPVTGEINWDCPCLGGMPHGPCGPEFREAFSCFIHSEDEPKGINCVEKFKSMQDCFRAHPDVYGEEIDDDDKSHEHHEGASLEALVKEAEAALTEPTPTEAPSENTTTDPAPSTPSTPKPKVRNTYQS